MIVTRANLVAVAFLAAALLGGCTGDMYVPTAENPALSPLGDARQAVVVIADDWNSADATLQCYERATPGWPWEAVGERIPVNIGRSGLAWGRGRHGDPAPAGLVKREGDGKAPAGVFELPFAFGYAPIDNVWDKLKIRYRPLTQDDVGVDDVKSKYYNQVVRTGGVAKDWDSAETMRRPDGLYEWGVFVNHNTAPARPGAGSCIFLHIGRGPGKPTAGCTSMGRAEMVRLITWLDPRCKPVLVQLPRSAYRFLAGPWGLPPESLVQARTVEPSPPNPPFALINAYLDSLWPSERQACLDRINRDGLEATLRELPLPSSFWFVMGGGNGWCRTPKGALTAEQYDEYSNEVATITMKLREWAASSSAGSTPAK